MAPQHDDAHAVAVLLPGMYQRGLLDPPDAMILPKHPISIHRFVSIIPAEIAAEPLAFPNDKAFQGSDRCITV
jgi:hypothetical protein